MLEVRQALGRGVAYLNELLGSDGSRECPIDLDPSTLAHVRNVLEALAARGVPGAVSGARVAGELLVSHAAAGATAGFTVGDASLEAGELMARQRADGSWPGADDCVDQGAVATATCLQNLAERVPLVFTDRDLERSFWLDGYVILDLLDRREIETLAQAHLRIEGTSVAGFYSTWFRSLEVRSETDRATRAVVAPRLKALFPSYRMVFGTFMSKGCEGETVFPMHQDPSLIDERQWTPLTFWIPLVDVDEVNGCMHVVRGSHLLCAEPRPSFAQFAYPDQEQELRRRHLLPVRMKAGQVLVFHSGLIHTSPANRSESLRVAAAGVMIPEAAQLQFCRINGSSQAVEIFAVEDSFYLRMQADDSFADLPKLGEYPAARPPLDLSRLPSTTDVDREPGGVDARQGAVLEQGAC